MSQVLKKVRNQKGKVGKKERKYFRLRKWHQQRVAVSKYRILIFLLGKPWLK